MNKKKQRKQDKQKQKQEAFAKIQTANMLKNIQWNMSRIDNYNNLDCCSSSLLNTSQASSYLSGVKYFDNGEM